VSPKPVRFRAVARRDVEAITAHHLTVAGGAVAERFADALDHALRKIGRYPGAGSPRYAHELGLPGVRAWRLARFPYLVFYREGADEIEIWRVLHGRRDLAAWLAKDPGPTQGR
jgi:toxin ParE1/3/4